MRAGEAKRIASRWVEENCANLPGFVGAMNSGSVNDFADDAVLPPASDVDVNVVVEGAAAHRSPGKFVVDGVMLDVSFADAAGFRDPDEVLGEYRLAHTVAAGGILSDPHGKLGRLHEAVSREFPKREQITRRVDSVLANSTRFLDSVEDAKEFPDAVMSWIFGTGASAHMLLVAGLRNPTVRRRYAATRNLLTEYEMLDLHEFLLGLLGVATISRPRTEHHLQALTRAFDAASAVVHSPFFFAPDISPAARHIAIDGSWELIESGLHREALFWIPTTFARCRRILSHDAPLDNRNLFETDFRELLSDLGADSSDKLLRRCAETRKSLKRIQHTAYDLSAKLP